MKLPLRITLQRRRLFVPAIFEQNVLATVAIDIAEAQTVRKPLILVLLRRNAVENPFLLRMPGIRSGITQIIAGNANQHRLPVSQEIAENGRFVVRRVNNRMTLPKALLVLRVLVPKRLLTGEPDDDDVRPAVAVDVRGKGEEILRVSIVDTKPALESGDCGHFPPLVGGAEGLLGRAVGVAGFEIRPFIPERAGDDVHVAIVVEISEIRALAPKLIRQLYFAEGGQALLRPGQGNPNRKRRKGDG